MSDFIWTLRRLVGLIVITAVVVMVLGETFLSVSITEGRVVQLLEVAGALLFFDTIVEQLKDRFEGMSINFESKKTENDDGGDG